MGFLVTVVVEIYFIAIVLSITEQVQVATAAYGDFTRMKAIGLYLQTLNNDAAAFWGSKELMRANAPTKPFPDYRIRPIPPMNSNHVGIQHTEIR